MSSNHSRHIWIAAAIMMLLLVSAPHSFAQTDKVVAKIGNQTVTESDLKEISNAVPEKFRHLYLTPEGRKKTLDYVVNIYVLAAEAERIGMDKKPEADKLLQFTRRDLLARLYLDQMSKDLPAPTDAEAKAFYETNKAQYATPESVHLHHILVASEKEAKDAMDKLKKGEKFADLASQISICPSKLKGGNLEWLPKGSLVPEIEEVAFSMKKRPDYRTSQIQVRISRASLGRQEGGTGKQLRSSSGLHFGTTSVPKTTRSLRKDCQYLTAENAGSN